MCLCMNYYVLLVDVYFYGILYGGMEEFNKFQESIKTHSFEFFHRFTDTTKKIY